MATDWTRSSFHQPTRLGDCVEVKEHGDGVVGVTDARRHEALSLLFSPESWQAFIASVKNGEFDFGAAAAPAKCICVRFRDTGGFRVGDLCCPVHGVNGTEPLDGPWEVPSDEQ